MADLRDDWRRDRERGRHGRPQDREESRRREEWNRERWGRAGEPEPGYERYGREDWGRDPGWNRGWEPTGYGRAGYGRDRDGERVGYGNDRSDRGWWDRASDEVSSWLGDDAAERRRQEDRGAAYHRGRGPRGYVRSDERIREDVSDRLTDNPILDASDIEVAVAAGEVTLSGSVDSRYSKRLAEDLTDEVSGVKHVQNNLRVRQIEQRRDSISGTYSGISERGTTSDVGRVASTDPVIEPPARREPKTP